MNYKQRVLNEFIELNDRIINLRHYIGSNTNTQLLEEQLKAMNTYAQILHERLMIMLDDKKEPIN